MIRNRERKIKQTNLIVQLNLRAQIIKESVSTTYYCEKQLNQIRYGWLVCGEKILHLVLLFSVAAEEVHILLANSTRENIQH